MSDRIFPGYVSPLVLQHQGHLFHHKIFVSQEIFAVSLILIPPPAAAVLCHRTVIYTATNCDVLIEGMRTVHKEKRKRMVSSPG